jgi:hypothetical protein
MNRLIFSCLALANAIVHCSASSNSIKVRRHSKRRRRLAGKSSKSDLDYYGLSVGSVDAEYTAKSSKTGLNNHDDLSVGSIDVEYISKSSKTSLYYHNLFVGSVDAEYIAKSAKANPVDAAVSSKSSKLAKDDGAGSTSSNLFEHVGENDGTAEAATNSKSAKSKASKSAKLEEDASNIFGGDSTTESDSPSQMPSVLSIDTSTILVEDHQSTSSADSLPPPGANVPAPTNAL